MRYHLGIEECLLLIAIIIIVIITIIILKLFNTI